MKSDLLAIVIERWERLGAISAHAGPLFRRLVECAYLRQEGSWRLVLGSIQPRRRSDTTCCPGRRLSDRLQLTLITIKKTVSCSPRIKRLKIKCEGGTHATNASDWPCSSRPCRQYRKWLGNYNELRRVLFVRRDSCNGRN